MQSNSSDIIFSIIIPTYNRAAFLKEAINSVIKQTFDRWELIIIDDGSTDHTKQLVNKYRDQRIQYHYQINQERSVARNHGMSHAKGLYLCFLDDDDYYLRKHLESLFKVIRQEGFPKSILITGASFNKNGKIIQKPFPKKGKLIEKIWLKGYSPVFIAYHRESIKDLRFNSNVQTMEDFLFLMECILSGNDLIPIQVYTAIQREHQDRSLNQTNIDKLNLEREHRIQVIRYLEKHYCRELKKQLSNQLVSRRKAADFITVANKFLRTGYPFKSLEFGKKALTQHSSLSNWMKFSKLLIKVLYAYFRHLYRKK